MGVRISRVCHPTPTLTPLHSSHTFLLLLPVHTPLSSVTSLSCNLLWLTSWRVLGCLNPSCLWNSKAQFSGSAPEKLAVLEKFQSRGDWVHCKSAILLLEPAPDGACPFVDTALFHFSQ